MKNLFSPYSGVFILCIPLSAASYDIGGLCFIFRFHLNLVFLETELAMAPDRRQTFWHPSWQRWIASDLCPPVSITDWYECSRCFYINAPFIHTSHQRKGRFCYRTVWLYALRLYWFLALFEDFSIRHGFMFLEAAAWFTAQGYFLHIHSCNIAYNLSHKATPRFIESYISCNQFSCHSLCNKNFYKALV